MPGFDGTGPMGQGPMTGGGWGYCAQDGRRVFGRGFRGGLRGRGRGFFGRGGGFGPWRRPGGTTAWDETSNLQARTETLETAIQEIRDRLGELESAD
ncbi:MAG: DUF5320 domain-containing protein [Deltaproteobacteria bacterium]|nr:DUF5320 domain-containing protein [Deltaproteobacteria bacterium]